MADEIYLKICQILEMMCVCRGLGGWVVPLSNCSGHFMPLKQPGTGLDSHNFGGNFLNGLCCGIIPLELQGLVHFQWTFTSSDSCKTNCSG